MIIDYNPPSEFGGVYHRFFKNRVISRCERIDWDNPSFWCYLDDRAPIGRRVWDALFLYITLEIVHSLVERHFPIEQGISFNLVISRTRSATYTVEVGFVIYEYILTRLGISFLFFSFEIGILNCLNVCPAQLHYNTWLHICLFQSIYDRLDCYPTVEVFFHLFEV